MLTARRNSAQGLLSTTYILDLEYRVVGDGGEAEQKSLFVKVTLDRGHLSYYLAMFWSGPAPGPERCECEGARYAGQSAARAADLHRGSLHRSVDDK